MDTLDQAHQKWLARRFSATPDEPSAFACLDPFRTDEAMAEALEDGPGYHAWEMALKDHEL